MHELAIAQNLADMVRRELAERRLERILGLTVRIGELTDVYPDALEFGYKMVTDGTDLEGCRLAILRIPAEAVCRKCEREVRIEQLVFVCPECGSTDLDIRRGMELDIAYLEVEDDSDRQGE